MAKILTLGKYSLGVGDRFAHQAKAQLRACMMAADQGVEVIPVWNKSHREHVTIGSEPATTRLAADAAVKALGWRKPHHVDADHIRLETVDRFLPHADFYTIDVADGIGKPPQPGKSSASPNVIRSWSEALLSRGLSSRSTSRARRSSKSPPSISWRWRKPAGFTAMSPSSRVRTSSSPRFPWTKRIARKRRPNCC